MAVSASTAAIVGGGNAHSHAEVSTDIRLARKRKAEDQLLLVGKCRNADVRLA